MDTEKNEDGRSRMEDGDPRMLERKTDARR
jgi:hypothetical protein